MRYEIKAEEASGNRPLKKGKHKKKRMD